jgi:signal recognition particle receptor subunit beta
MKENRGNYRVKMKDGKDKDIELVDIPGDERISLRSFKQSIDTLMGLILVVDSVNFPHESRDLCHLIIDIMSDVKVYRKRFPMLIACNKQDMVLACSIDNIRDKLESEM